MGLVEISRLVAAAPTVYQDARLRLAVADWERCCVRSSWTNKLITAKDHASVQINVGHLDANGVYTGAFTTLALAGSVRAMVRAFLLKGAPFCFSFCKATLVLLGLAGSVRPKQCFLLHAHGVLWPLQTYTSSKVAEQCWWQEHGACMHVGSYSAACCASKTWLELLLCGLWYCWARRSSKCGLQGCEGRCLQILRSCDMVLWQGVAGRLPTLGLLAGPGRLCD